MFKPLLVGSWILVGLGLDNRSNFKVFASEIPSFLGITIETQCGNLVYFQN
jgi:hypothetical protein